MKILRIAAGATALLLLASGAQAQEEGEFAKNILGSMGIVPKDPPKIDYRERPALVLPQKMELRPPVEGGATERRVANWPKDPDVLAARKEAREASLPYEQTEVYQRSRQNSRLSIEEMRAGRRAGAGVPSAPAEPEQKSSRMSPDQLRALGTSEAKLDSKGLQRRYLSDPPQDLLNAAGGGTLKPSFEPVDTERDPTSPTAFQRQQQRR